MKNSIFDEMLLAIARLIVQQNREKSTANAGSEETSKSSDGVVKIIEVPLSDLSVGVLQKKLKESIAEQNFERSIVIRDVLKNKKSES